MNSKKNHLKITLMHYDIEQKALEYIYFYKKMLFQVPSVFHLIITNGCNQADRHGRIHSNCYWQSSPFKPISYLLHTH